MVNKSKAVANDVTLVRLRFIVIVIIAMVVQVFVVVALPEECRCKSILERFEKVVVTCFLFEFYLEIMTAYVTQSAT